jgi:hypothetical protein
MAVIHAGVLLNYGAWGALAEGMGWRESGRRQARGGRFVS